MGKLSRGAVSLLFLFASLFARTPEALAVDLPDNCHHESANVWWDGIPLDLLSKAVSGAEFWESRPNFLGSGPVIPISTSLASGDTLVTWLNLPVEEAYGEGLCGLRVVHLNPDYYAAFKSSPDLFKWVVAHEIGHVLGFGHVGDGDSWDGDVPVMRPCVGVDDTDIIESTLRQDDYAVSRWGRRIGSEVSFRPQLTLHSRMLARSGSAKKPRSSRSRALE